MSLIDRFKRGQIKGLVLMSRYEQLLTENEHIKIRDTHSLPDGYSGFYNDGIILIDKTYPKHEKLKCYTKNLHIINLHMGTS